VYWHVNNNSKEFAELKKLYDPPPDGHAAKVVAESLYRDFLAEIVDRQKLFWRMADFTKDDMLTNSMFNVLANLREESAELDKRAAAAEKRRNRKSTKSKL
jgi:hypothetical protein